MTTTHNKSIFHLADRAVLRVEGEDAQDFLHNIFTNDVHKLQAGQLQYNLLLTPQGQVLHDAFILRHEDGFLIDGALARQPDLMRRLTMFKLRAKVSLSPSPLQVYASTAAGDVAQEGWLQDPRGARLGRRFYGAALDGAVSSAHDYDDLLISLGIPTPQAIAYERDFSHEVNLDLLHAIAWDKGCFIGQEVAARVHHKGLAKKRLYVVQGSKLSCGKIINEDGTEVGQIRHVDRAQTSALAVVKTPENRTGSMIFEGQPLGIRPGAGMAD